MPEQRNFSQAYELATLSAESELAGIPDITSLADKSGSRIADTAKPALDLNFINCYYRIAWPDFQIDPEPGAREKMLILHYLICAHSLNRSSMVTGNPVSYQQLPPGLLYLPVFIKRTINHIVKSFSSCPGKLAMAGLKLGGREAQMGDEAVTVYALPRVPVTFLIWYGDDEFEPSGNILFDESILSYLPAEDVTILSELLTWKLIKSVM